MSTKLAWIYLVIAGLSEVAWAIGLPYTRGFTKLWPSLYVLLMMLVSFLCLSQSLKILPIGTAYAIWTGIGAAGTAILGILILGEPVHALRVLCIMMIVAGTIGLKFLHG